MHSKDVSLILATGGKEWYEQHMLLAHRPSAVVLVRSGIY